jgi:uncharacterized membrane protein YjgN (DUF898 family)
MDDTTSAPQMRRSIDEGFAFTGDWKEFLPIAVTNLLLTIVTLGIYRFWAKARERRYLWSRTHFVDDSFEWTGTGLEMLIGFLIVMLVLIPAFLFFNFGLQAMVLRGEALLAGILAFVFYLGLFYLFNVARFRAIRYRLSRTYWHGIRGGSDDGGWHYGWSGMWKMALGWLALGLLVPWAMTSLWNERWNKMSYGPYMFEADAGPAGLMIRWFLLYLVPVVGFVVAAVVGFGGLAMGAAGGGSEAAMQGAILTMVVMVIGIYLAVILLSLSYFAAFFRVVAAATSLAGLRFEFRARTKDWLMLILGNIGLVIITLGIGLLFLSYRNWKFIVSHMGAAGEIDFAALTQSTTRAPSEAEGLADAFDIGAV